MQSVAKIWDYMLSSKQSQIYKSTTGGQNGETGENMTEKYKHCEYWCFFFVFFFLFQMAVKQN